MTRPRIFEADVYSAEHGTTAILLAFAGIYGIFTINDGADRWQAPVYQTALLVPGSPESWGWALLIFSVMAVFGYQYSRRVLTLGKLRIRLGAMLLVSGLFMIGIWCLFFGLAFLREYLRNETVSIGGAAIYITFAVLYILRSVMYWRGTRDTR